MGIIKNIPRRKTGWSWRKNLEVSGEKKIKGNQTEIVEWEIKNSLERINSGWQSTVCKHQKVGKHPIPATEKRGRNEPSLQTRDDSKGSNMCVLERKTALNREVAKTNQDP